MLHLNTFWKLLQFTLSKSYEQRLVKIIYLTSPIFVVVLKVNSSLYEFFSGFLEKVLVLYFKWLKPAAGLVCNYLKLSRDLFAKFLFQHSGGHGTGAMPPPPHHAHAGVLPSPCHRGRGGRHIRTPTCCSTLSPLTCSLVLLSLPSRARSLPPWCRARRRHSGAPRLDRSGQEGAPRRPLPPPPSRAC